MDVHADLDAKEALDLAHAVGWPWTLPRVQRVIDMQPEGAFAVRDGSGALLGMGTCVVWDELAWLGGLAVAPHARGRGVSRALVDHILAFAAERGARTVGLDATTEGRQLYERAGFVAWHESGFWERPAGAQRANPGPSGDYAVYPVSSCEIMELLDFDRPRFGASRARLLSRLISEWPHHSFVSVHRRTGAFSGLALRWDDRVGPLVAESPAAAAWLLHAVERAGATPKALVAEWNDDAKRVFAAAGYQPKSRTTRMFRGPAPPGRAETVYAPAIWALG